ncbi:MAG: SHOCT domain-containing protein [Candidatus Dormibacterales bacterium]
MMWGYSDGAGWLWMVPMMVLFWGGLIALVYFVARAFSGPKSIGDPAMATLRQRLAAGQISQEEFDKTKRILQG